MAFYKLADSNLPNQTQEIAEVIDFKNCEKCGEALDMMSSSAGSIKCPKCGFKNSISNHNNAE